MRYTYTTNDLMKMGRRLYTRVDQRIKTVDNELRASKANQRMAWRHKG